MEVSCFNNRQLSIIKDSKWEDNTLFWNIVTFTDFIDIHTFTKYIDVKKNQWVNKMALARQTSPSSVILRPKLRHIVLARYMTKSYVRVYAYIFAATSIYLIYLQAAIVNIIFLLKWINQNCMFHEILLFYWSGLFCLWGLNISSKLRNSSIFFDVVHLRFYDCFSILFEN